MMRGRIHLRSRSPLPVLILGLALALNASLLAASQPVRAASGSAQVRQLALMWCVVAGSPTAQDPGAVGALDGEPGSDLSTVLWRRHERVSDQIFIPQAYITFRSALEQLRRQDQFPIIPDPDTSRDQPGDINFSGDTKSVQEVQDVVRDCQEAWLNILRPAGIATIAALPGIPVINVRQLAGSATLAYGNMRWRTGDISQHATYVTGSYVLIQDRRFFASGTEDAHTLGHELGHTLGLWHTSPPENLMTTQNLSGLKLSANIQDAVDFTQADLQQMHLTGTVPRTINQIEWVQEESKKWPSAVLDPLGTLFAGPYQSFVRVDSHQDVAPDEPFVDISSVTISEDQPSGLTQVTYRLLGWVTPDVGPGDLDYWALVDVDHNATTGASGSDLILLGVPPTPFTGVELVTRVRRELDPPAAQTLRAAVWVYQVSNFVAVTQGVEAFFARGVVLHPSPPRLDPTFDYITLQLPTAVRGTVANLFRVQAVAHNLATGTVDLLPDNGEGSAVSLDPPTFPECRVTPGRMTPGNTVTVDLTGLDPDARLHVVLGDRAIADGATDRNGEASVPFAIPPDARAGLRLVTVGNDGTAVTADCIVEVACPDFVDPSGVDRADLLAILAHWGRQASDPGWEEANLQRFDLDGNGMIALQDLILAAQFWGMACGDR